MLLGFDAPETMPAEDVTLNAIWEAVNQEFTINYYYEN